VGAPGVLERVAALVRRFGLNLIGAADVAAYDALVPASHRLGLTLGARRTAIVVGHGGSGFWEAYRAHVRRHPEHERHPDPIDAFTAWIMEEQVLLRVPDATLVLPFQPVSPPVSFVHLAEAAGLGRRGLVGVLIHPEFGPWIALRGVLFVTEAVVAPRPAAGFDPCPSCIDRPCLAACPGAAVSAATGWDVPRCIDHRIAHTADCRDACGARVACVYGRAHRYPPEALGYHQARAFALMAATRATGD
jgi:hypothetical protein